MSKEVIKFALAVTGVVLGWSLVVPTFEFPDEQAHFGSVSYLIQNGYMPRYGKQDLTDELAETQKLLGIFRDGNGNNAYTYHPDHHVTYTTNLTGLYESDIQALNTRANRTNYVGSEAAKYPPLYYAYISLFTRTVDTYDIVTRLYVSRLAGLVGAFLMTLIMYQIGLFIFNKKIYAKTLVLLTMMQPMMSFVSAGLNSDNLHTLLFTLILYSGLRLIRDGIRVKDILLIALAIVLDIYTKPQGFIGITLAGFAILLAVIRSKQWKMLGWVGVIGMTAIALGAGQWNQYKDLFMVKNVYNVSFIEYVRFTANKLLAQNVVWYWGVFKWLGVVMPPMYWRLANRVVLAGSIGLIIYLIRIMKKKKIVADPYSICFILCSSIIYALVIFWYDWQYNKINGYSLGIQARYFFPTIVGHMAILLTGILSFGWNSVSRKWIRRALILFFIWLQLGGIWRIITIYYSTSSINTVIAQASQYKPFFAKGDWWYLWGVVYVASLSFLFLRVWKNKK